MFKRHVIILFLLAAFVPACASTGQMVGLNTAAKTAELRPGMTFAEVAAILGKPKSSIFTETEWQVNYTLHEYYKGWVPYVLAFDKETQRLKSWGVDEVAYQRNQEMWMQTLSAMEQEQQQQQQQQQAGAYGGGYGGSGGYGDSTFVAPTYDPGSYEPSQFELDSAGYPGGAYDNPSSSYYDYNTYDY